MFREAFLCWEDGEASKRVRQSDDGDEITDFLTPE